MKLSDMDADLYLCEYIIFWVKSIFGHPTLASVWFWPLNSKTGYLRPLNYENHLFLTIGLFRWVVLLTWTPRGSGAHLSALLPLSSFYLPLSLSCIISLFPSTAGGRGRPVGWGPETGRAASQAADLGRVCAGGSASPASRRPCPVRWRAERIRAAGAPALGLAGGSLVLLDLLRLRTACFRGGVQEGERDMRDKEGDREKKDRGDNTDKWAHLHVASMSAKPPCKIAGWPNVNGFDSWIVENIRFWSSMVKTKPGLKFNGQKWTFSNVEWFCFVFLL